MINRTTFGAFIREKRNEKDLTQKELAEKLYVSESAVSKWEMGKSYPDITLIPDLCEVLDVSEHELIAGASDLEFRKMKRDAFAYRRLSEGFFKAFTVSYIIAFVICLVCDIAINHRISFSIIVFGALLVAFSFVPTWIRFTDKHKLAVFAVTTYISLLVMFLICCIYFSRNWFGIASFGVLLGYVCLFGPFLLKKYIPENYQRYCLLIYFTAIFAVTLLLLLTVRITVDYPLIKGILIASYIFIDLAVIGIVHIMKIKRTFKAAIDLLVSGILYFFLPFVLQKILGENMQNNYEVDLSDWEHYTNGNIAIIILVVFIVISAIMIMIGIVKDKRKKASGKIPDRKS